MADTISETYRLRFLNRAVFFANYRNLCRLYDLARGALLLTDGTSAWHFQPNEESWSIPLVAQEHDTSELGQCWRLLPSPPISEARVVEVFQHGLIMHFRVYPVRGYAATDGWQAWYCRDSATAKGLGLAIADTQFASEFPSAEDEWDPWL